MRLLDALHRLSQLPPLAAQPVAARQEEISHACALFFLILTKVFCALRESAFSACSIFCKDFERRLKRLGTRFPIVPAGGLCCPNAYAILCSFWCVRIGAGVLWAGIFFHEKIRIMSAKIFSRDFAHGKVRKLQRIKQPIVLHLQDPLPRNPVLRALFARSLSSAAGKHVRSQGAQRRADKVALQRSLCGDVLQDF